MASPPETDRQFAYLRITGEGPSSRIGETLGLKPSKAWTAGERFERNGNELKRKFTHWRLDSGLDDTHPLHAHVDALVARLIEHRSQLLSLIPDYRLCIQCVSYQYQSCGLNLNVDTLRGIVSLGLGLDFDMYSFGDLHEEMIDLRARVSLLSSQGISLSD